MKINGNGYNQYVNNVRYNQEKAQNKETTNAGTAGNKESVQVNISDAAKQIAKVGTTEGQSARVEAIKKAVQSGTYKVSPEKISGKIMDTIKEQRNIENK